MAKRTIPPKSDAWIENALKQQALFSLTSVIASRASLASRMGKSFGGKRDLFEALGYPLTLTYDDYYGKYIRGDISARIIDAPVDGSWSLKPEIVEDSENETAFEKDISELNGKQKLFHYLKRADTLSCIGQYAVLLLGVDDNQEMDQPLESAKELLYLQPYSECSAEIKEYEKDTKNPRFGLPYMYQLKIQEPGNINSYQTKRVHHSRVIHIAQGLLESNAFGLPKLQRVYNRLLSLELIVGGSGEMFWQGAFPGFHFDADPETNMTSTATEMKESIDKYVHGLKRYLTTQGMDIKTLAPSVADPANHVDVQITMISAATGIPKRILMGSERGELASSQDGKNWNDRLDSRRIDEVEPTIIRPTIDRLIEIGVISPPANGEYNIIWPDLNASSSKEKADTGKVLAEAMDRYLASGADVICPPKQFFEEILDMDVVKVQRIMDGVEGLLEDLRDEERDASTADREALGEGEKMTSGQQQDQDNDNV